MKKIEPDSIKELNIMPYLLGVLILGGILVAATGNKKLFVAWMILFIILGIAGAVDFYLWEYDYGHNLSPTAPIKVPGMAYQPPLIGKKTLLNFVAYSYPSFGSLFFGLSILSGFIAFWSSKKKQI